MISHFTSPSDLAGKIWEANYELDPLDFKAWVLALGSQSEFLRFILLGLAFIAALVPETKGRSFAEIEALLSRPRRDVPLIPMDS